MPATSEKPVGFNGLIPLQLKYDKPVAVPDWTYAYAAFTASFISSAVLLVVLIAWLSTGNVKVPWTVKPVATKPAEHAKPSQPVQRSPAQPVASTAHPSAPVPVARAASSPDELAEPYSGRGIHLTGYLETPSKRVYTFVMSQNGQHIANVTDDELKKAGYDFEGHSQCSGVLKFGTFRRVVLCDAPSMGVKILGGGSKA